MSKPQPKTREEFIEMLNKAADAAQKELPEDYILALISIQPVLPLEHNNVFYISNGKREFVHQAMRLYLQRSVPN